MDALTPLTPHQKEQLEATLREAVENTLQIETTATKILSVTQNDHSYQVTLNLKADTTTYLIHHTP